MSAAARGGPGPTSIAAMLTTALVLVAITALRHPIARTVGDEAPPDALRPWPDMRLDLNAATAAELSVLPGIGPALSDRIVADRQANGPFASIDDLRRVKHVGPVLVSEIREYVVVEAPRQAPIAAAGGVAR